MSSSTLLSPWLHQTATLAGERRRISSSPQKTAASQVASPIFNARSDVRLGSSSLYLLQCCCRWRPEYPLFRCYAGEAAAEGGEGSEGRSSDAQDQENKGFMSKWKTKTAEMSSKLAQLGLSAVLAYGLFDAVTYTTFFILAFLGYEKSTGKNPAANIQALLGIVILMWTGNNVTRPFRVAGAAALAPFIDKGLNKIQKHFKFSKQIYAFALVVSIVAGFCFTIVGLLILSRWGK